MGDSFTDENCISSLVLPKCCQISWLSPERVGKKSYDLIQNQNVDWCLERETDERKKEREKSSRVMSR